jgi:hypothetical protein
MRAADVKLARADVAAISDEPGLNRASDPGNGRGAVLERPPATIVVGDVST